VRRLRENGAPELGYESLRLLQELRHDLIQRCRRFDRQVAGLSEKVVRQLQQAAGTEAGEQFVAIVLDLLMRMETPGHCTFQGPPEAPLGRVQPL